MVSVGLVDGVGGTNISTIHRCRDSLAEELSVSHEHSAASDLHVISPTAKLLL